jgi:hypothetical protein
MVQSFWANVLCAVAGWPKDGVVGSGVKNGW